LLSLRIVEAAVVKLFIPSTDFGTAQGEGGLENRGKGRGGRYTVVQESGELLLGDGVVMRRVIHIEDEMDLLIEGPSSTKRETSHKLIQINQSVGLDIELTEEAICRTQDRTEQHEGERQQRRSTKTNSPPRRPLRGKYWRKVSLSMPLP
jgi:hypothetical protein